MLAKLDAFSFQAVFAERCVHSCYSEYSQICPIYRVELTGNTCDVAGVNIVSMLELTNGLTGVVWLDGSGGQGFCIGNASGSYGRDTTHRTTILHIARTAECIAGRCRCKSSRTYRSGRGRVGR